jgi:hypothetical protein
MNSQRGSVFKKTAACPASSTLLSYRGEKLSKPVLTLVRLHLDACEFCAAEVALLAFHRQSRRGEDKTPEIPMNLRILAESLLCQNSKTRIIR